MSETHLPETEEAAANIIRQHFDTGQPLNIQGGNTRSGFGHPVSASVLSSRNLSGIVAYNPAELTMTVKSGTPVS